jgi:DNA invertase Pin-like site-specific DNA recombinase
MIFGYSRVSTDAQSVEVQNTALKAAGVVRIFSEKISCAKSHGPQLQRMLKALGKDDTVIVTRLDRIARNTRDLLNILDSISRAGATFKSLADAGADTTTPHGRLMLTILGGLAEFERELITARISEGRKVARAKGVKFGPKFKLTPHQRAEALSRRNAGESLVNIARSYDCSHITINRL